VTVATHPAASLETLSRRHDGELTPAEGAAFEAHLAKCEECREATAAFDRSLAAFRAAPEAAVPSDLPARILRKIRAQTPSRRPFGVMFGIDIRWAGVFLAALLVAIIAPVFLASRRQLSRGAPVPSSAPLTAYLVDAEPDAGKETHDERQKQQTQLQAGTKGDAAANAVAAGSPELKTRARAAEPAAAADQLAGGSLDRPVAPAPAAASAAAPAAERAPSADFAAKAGPRRSAAFATPDQSGGEAGLAAREEAQTGGVRLDVRPLDSQGGAPDVASTPAADRLAPLRGREFVVVVGADGFVRSVEPPGQENERSHLQKDARAAAASPSVHAEADKKAESATADEGAVAALRDLRFQATGKARRLLVHIR
jgi:predicted anti-sigma-YlaC factor YlaD